MDPGRPRRSVIRIGGKAKRCQKTGLKMFTTKRKALVIAERARASHGVPIYFFRCEHCGCWHLTKRKQPPKPAS